MLANEVINLTLDGSIQPLSYQAGVSQVETATVVGTITGDGNATVVTTAASVTGSPITTSVAVDDGTAQVETATVVGTITGDGNAAVIVTAAGMTGSPKTVQVAVDNGTAQVETATAIGTITGDGNASVVVTAVGMTGTPKTVAVAVLSGTAQVETATAIGTVTGDGNASVVVTAAGMTGSPKTVAVAVDNGTAQVETATVAGTIDPAGAGDIDVTVTAVGMTGTPKTIQVAVANNDTASDVAGKVRAALVADADVGHVTTGFFVVTGATDQVILTAKANAANDGTMNIATATGTATGLTAAPTSANTTAGVAADDASAVAGKIRAALTSDADVGHVTTGFFVVSGATDAIILTAKAKAANDATLNVSIDNGTCTGLTAAPTSANTTAGVAPDTASAVGGKIRTALIADGDIGDAGTGFFTITGAGANVILTAKTIAANDATLNVSIDNGTCTGLTAAPTSANTTAGVAADTANGVATKIRAALTADADVGHATTGFFTVSGATDKVILTSRTKAANDATLNISIDNGTCTGLTTAATSANTTAGVAPDTASGVATKIRSALNGITAITDFFTIGGSGANITLTKTVPAATDNTLNLSIANGTCTGLTDALYSVQTTAGLASGALGIFTPKFLIRNPVGSGGNMLIGATSATNVTPATLTSANCLYELAPGDSAEVGEDNRSYWIGENYILSHWFVKGTASDVCKVTYVTRRTAATPS